MPEDVFETEAWFANLLAHGFERAPQQHWKWPLPVSSHGGTAYLHLMQQMPGKPLSALSNYYSCLYGPTGPLEAIHGLSAGQWRAAAKALRHIPGGEVLRLQPLDDDSPWLAALQSGLQAAGYWTNRYFCFGNWYQTVPHGGFGAYWAQRPSALRHSVSRGRRRLTRAGEWRVDIHTGESSHLDCALSAYEAVYSQSWKQPEPCPAFMPGLVHTAARQGWLRLGVLWAGDQPLAAQVWLVHAHKANIYKLAYVQGQDRFSPGSVLTAALMQHAMDVDRVLEVDYLSGDDAYKRDWMAQRRERIGLMAFDRRHWRGFLAWGRHRLGRLRSLVSGAVR
ncbi:GNAT family N-acetyltransferase [Acidovorax sp. SRB_24]|uniref:GNAT family N-acetyltransferase n=1 Tax=Acidovorax sp. SRB_24 TaxID=1962700 RepID=UPI001F113745|nr:GNAT family N-acetyltransferase [Acidovorax sp. SRB_24]